MKSKYIIILFLLAGCNSYESKPFVYHPTPLDSMIWHTDSMVYAVVKDSTPEGVIKVNGGIPPEYYIYNYLKSKDKTIDSLQHIVDSLRNDTLWMGEIIRGMSIETPIPGMLPVKSFDSFNNKINPELEAPPAYDKSFPSTDPSSQPKIDIKHKP